MTTVAPQQEQQPATSAGNSSFSSSSGNVNASAAANAASGGASSSSSSSNNNSKNTNSNNNATTATASSPPVQLTSLVLQRHIDASFDAFDLDQCQKLYVGDAVQALDSILTACWGEANRLSAREEQTGSLTLPGVSRAKILQAIKSALLKASVDPDEAVSEAQVVTKDVFQNAAESLLAPVPVHGVDTFAVFQSMNGFSEKTRVNRRALRRSLFQEYDAVVYAKKDDEDELDDRLRSGSAYSIATNTGSTKENVVLPLTMEDGPEHSSLPSEGGNQEMKFDMLRNFVGCDDLLLKRYADYPKQGFSFDEFKMVMAPVVETKRRLAKQQASSASSSAPSASAAASAASGGENHQPAEVEAAPLPNVSSVSTPSSSSS